MDDQTEGVKPEGEAETTPTTTPVEEETTEVTQEDSSKKGENARIRELNERAKQAEAKAKSLSERIAELTSPVGQSGQVPQFTPQVNQPGFDEETEKKLQEREQRILQQASFIAQRTSALDRINRETEAVVEKYPELDTNSDSYDKELSDTIYEAVEAKVKSDPSASVKAFVERQMNLYKRGVSKEEKQTEKVIAKQASQGAIRTSANVKPEEKQDSDKTIAELEAELGFFQG